MHYYHCHTRVLMGLSILVMGLGMLANAVHAQPEPRVTLCHYPPGNPGNAREITVGASAVPAHVAHGDSVGPCAQDCRQHPAVCNDSNVCTTDSCDTSNGTCVYTPVNCNDSNVCTTDSCDTIKGCLHDAVSCDDGTQCTTDSCDPTMGCAHGTVSCDDQNPCTIDFCVDAAGCGRIPIVCGPGETCDPTTGNCCALSGESCDPSNPGACCSGRCTLVVFNFRCS